jgi:SAM-dependent methyltransferase
MPGMALRWLAGTVAGGRAYAAMRELNARHPWSHNDHFHSWIMVNLPVQRRMALDVGCGRGELLAALAPAFGSVVGTDLDDGMRRQAASRCAGLPNVTIYGSDLTEMAGPFDLVTMVAVLHHLEVKAALHEVRRMLAPGGRFLVVGLALPRSARDHLWDLASIVTNPIIGYAKHPWPSQAGAQSPPFPVAEPTLSFDQIHQQVAEVMPGAVLRHHLGFRHTIAWTMPPDT